MSTLEKIDRSGVDPATIQAVLAAAEKAGPTRLSFDSVGAVYLYVLLTFGRRHPGVHANTSGERGILAAVDRARDEVAEFMAELLADCPALAADCRRLAGTLDMPSDATIAGLCLGRFARKYERTWSLYEIMAVDWAADMGCKPGITSATAKHLRDFLRDQHSRIVEKVVRFLPAALQRRSAAELGALTYSILHHFGDAPSLRLFLWALVEPGNGLVRDILSFGDEHPALRTSANESPATTPGESHEPA